MRGCYMQLLDRAKKYWCPLCHARFLRKKQFEEHFIICKRDAKADYEAMLAERAPRNRKERRMMAKDAGMIKDWKKLNS